MRLCFSRLVPAIPSVARFHRRHAAPARRARSAAAGALSLLALPFALAFVLGGCAVEGDFGRPAPPTFMDRLADFPLSKRRPLPARWQDKSVMTADEREMRETAYRVRTEIHSFKPVGGKHYSDGNYADYLTRQGHVYGPSRMASIDHELHADHQALTLFGQAAERVLVADMERVRALHEEAPYLTGEDTRRARSRIRDNYAFVEGTFRDLRERIVAYEYAIDRTRIETPGVSTAAVMSSLNHLRDRAASLEYKLSQTVAMAGRGGAPGSPRVLKPGYKDRAAGPHPYK